MLMGWWCCDKSGNWTSAGRLWPVATGLASAALLQATAAHAQEYEIWALDQGTHIVHIYNAELTEADRIDLGAEGARSRT